MVKQATPWTVKTYHRILKAFCNYLVAEGELSASPMERIKTPVDRPDQITPFTLDELHSLLAAAGKSKNAKRDEAILLLMLDTAVRASELCALLVGDVDFSASTVRVREGMGDKGRTVPFSGHTKKATFVLATDDGERIRLEQISAATYGWVIGNFWKLVGICFERHAD